jgi:hypothetical protein
MAVTRLSDAFVHDVYGSYSALNGPETSAFYRAGVIANSPVLDEIARAGGKQVTIPFWQDLDPTVEPNYSNDDPADEATADAISSATMTARKAWVNKGYGDMDLVQELAGSSPMQQIRNRFGEYWVRQLNRRLINAALGVLADNVANDGGDMTVDISGLTGTDAVFGSDAFIDAAYTAGDRADMFTAIAVHSSIMARMVKNDEIVYIPDSEGKLTIATYKGRVVVADDSMPVTGGVYTSILFGKGAFGFGGIDGAAFALGEGVPRVPFELWRNPHAGNGGGLEEIWERKTWLLHPFGFEWIEAGGGALTEFSPTLANLRTGAKWNRVVFRKAVPMAFIKSRAVAA